MDVTAEYIEESLDELQTPSTDAPNENRLRTIRTPVKAVCFFGWAQGEGEPIPEPLYKGEGGHAH